MSKPVSEIKGEKSTLLTLMMINLNNDGEESRSLRKFITLPKNKKR